MGHRVHSIQSFSTEILNALNFKRFRKIGLQSYKYNTSIAISSYMGHYSNI